MPAVKPRLHSLPMFSIFLPSRQTVKAFPSLAASMSGSKKPLWVLAVVVFGMMGILRAQSLPATQGSLDENSKLIFSYERPYPIPVGLTYLVEAGNDLIGWDSEGLEVIGNDVNGHVESVVVRDSVIINSSNPRRFMRLRILPNAVASVSIRPDGWTADITFFGLVPGGVYSLFPDTETPSFALTVVSPGFDAEAQPTTVQRRIIGTVPLRKPYPDQLSKTEVSVEGGVKVTVALSDRIYRSDTVAECTLREGLFANGSQLSPSGRGQVVNESTLPYPKPVGNWCEIPYERAKGASHAVEFLAFHRHPRSGRQVACVEFLATDETGQSTSVKTSAMVASTKVTGGNPVAVYRGEIPLGPLNQGENITVRAKVYPFLGDAASVLDSDPTADGFPIPNPNLTNLIFLNDRTGGHGTVYAYVSPTGNNTTATASTNADTASSAPFLTIQAAATAIRNLNSTSFGRDNVSGGIIRLTEGLHAGFGAAINTLPTGKSWLTIESAPGTNPQNVIFTAGTHKRPPSLVKFRNLLFQPAGTGSNHIVIDGVVDNSTIGPPELFGAWENVEFAGLIEEQGQMVYRVGMRYYLNCRFKNLRTSLTFPTGNTRAHTPLLAGCTMEKSTTTAVNWNPHLAVGNILRDGNQLVEVASGTTSPVIPPEGFVIAFNSTYELEGTSTFCNAHPSTRGAAFVQNLFERTGTASGTSFTIGKDSSVQPLNNIIVQYTTTTGGRTNFLYNDIGTEGVPKNGLIQFSILYQLNIKTDTFSHPTFGPNGNRIGNWEPVHGVGFLGNIYQYAAANGPSFPYYSPTSWNGSYTGLSIQIAVSPGFVNDQGYTAGNGGNGDYRLTADSAGLNRVPAGLSALPFDLAGTPRRDDGTGAIGAYEFQSE